MSFIALGIHNKMELERRKHMSSINEKNPDNKKNDDNHL